ncbi:hypothetical protein DTW90_23785 [Neorhizobium sp. P12A]|uniref:hypothetical protein n=1 Tax=Neorhizobium sp. P12A TaxID=2268027 RepID=UPI0011EED70D|nr:hypothetical protein [Neorhizobium sp. P12A]KAA0694356.1 hypothetical protein DTW90_23785 [Neorhizobium sp. P12A]
MNQDKALGLQATAEEKREFEIAWLQHRVKNLEDIVLELLRDNVNHELVDGYRKALERKNTFTPSTADIKDRGRSIAALLNKGYPADSTRWPPKGE